MIADLFWFNDGDLEKMPANFRVNQRLRRRRDLERSPNATGP